MNRKVVSKRIPAFAGREIVISDIHGDLDSYEMLLEKTGYTPGIDRLILLGDLTEKGPKNLALLRRIMKQTKEENVLAIMGNCDFTAKNFLFSYRLDFIRDILLNRRNSLIHEMIEEAGLPALTKETDMNELACELRSRYLEELSFLNDLPQVLESPKRIYVHAGLLDEKTYADDFRYVLTLPLFANTDHFFTKTIVVGHMPVTEYCRQKADFNPWYNPAANIYSIDGGNVVKKAGQLNALIFDGNLVSTVSVSSLPTATVRKTVRPSNPAPFVISFNRGQIEMLEKGEKQSLVYSPYLNRRFWVDTAFIHQNRVTDFTNYEMPLNAGETVETVCSYGSKTQIKKMGVLGWTWTENLIMGSEHSESCPL